jgi:hypothetical protein
MAGAAIGFIAPFAAAARDTLAGRHRPAHLLDAVPVAGLDAVLAAGDADLLDAALGHAAGDRAADGLVAGFANRPAHRAADFLAARLADLLAALMAAGLAVLFVNRLAHGVAAFLLAAARDFTADLALNLLDAALGHRTILDALHFLPARAIARFAAVLDHVAVAGLVASPVHGLAFFAIAGLGDLLVDRLADRLAAGVPAFFADGVIDQLVAGPVLVLAFRVTTLCVAARLATARVRAGAAVLGAGRLGGCEQSDQGDQERHSFAHPHD